LIFSLEKGKIGLMSVTRNTLALLVSSVAQKAIAFVYFALIARWAGVEDTGKYFFALSWSLMFSIVTDVGLTSVLIREVAKKPAETARYLSQVITLKIPLLFVAAVCVVGGVWLLGYPPITRNMVALSAIVLALDAVSLSFYGTLRGHQMLKYEGIGLVIGQTLTLVSGLLILKSGASMVWLMCALILGSLWNAVMSFVVVRRKLGIMPKLVWDKPFAMTLLKTALPFALAGAFVKLYTNADVVLLNKFAGDAAAGIYAVPYKLTFAFQFIPMAFTAALYPAMSRDYVQDKERLGKLFYKALWYLALICAPIVAGIVVLAPEIVRFVYGPAYGAAVLPLQLMIPTIVFIFLDFPVGSLLNASDRQMTQTKLMGLAMIISVGLNFALIPSMGVMGVVIASLVSHAALFATGLVVIGKFLDWPRRKLFDLCLRTGLSAAAMGLAVFFAKSHAPLVVAILFGAALYPPAVLLTGALTVNQAGDLIATVFRRKSLT
jgi:O-antigen/teichoic acid export membrane protein